MEVLAALLCSKDIATHVDGAPNRGRIELNQHLPDSQHIPQSLTNSYKSSLLSAYPRTKLHLTRYQSLYRRNAWACGCRKAHGFTFMYGTFSK